MVEMHRQGWEMNLEKNSANPDYKAKAASGFIVPEIRTAGKSFRKKVMRRMALRDDLMDFKYYPPGLKMKNKTASPQDPLFGLV